MSVFQASDILMVIHRPETLNIFQYSIEKWETKNLVYLHLLKVRDGETKILVFENQLKYNRLEEYDPYSNFLKEKQAINT